MKQPELGIKICEIRNQKNITQKELSESCKVDIRTIQRIESGEVTPRISTLKLLAEALNSDIEIFNEEKHNNSNYLSSSILLAIFITGIIYFISFILTLPIIPKNNFLLSINLFMTIIYTLSGFIFYYGFYLLGEINKNLLLKISSIIIMVLIPLFLISMLITPRYSYGEHIFRLVTLIMGLNCILFGIGLFKTNNHWKSFYKISGILQVLIAPFFIIQEPIINFVGFCLTIPFILSLLSIVYLEFRESKKLKLQSESL
jgi:transcriptional regulator with XRE-family HTH domain